MKRALYLLLLFATTAGFSQINYEPGYFIDNAGNRTECLIRNVAWKNSPVDFEYKLLEADAPKTASIKDIKEFNVSSYKFRRYTLKIDRSSSLVDKLSNKKEPEWTTETLFLKVLVEGKATLYQYEDSNLVKYFYSTGEHSAAEQLVYKEYTMGSLIGENNQYRQQLYMLMKDRLTEMKRFEKLKYKAASLVDLFTEYNGSEGTNLTATQNRGKINLKVTAGASMASLNVLNTTVKSWNFDFEDKTIFRAGLEVEYILPFNNNKWALFIDPNYQSYSNTGTKGGDNWTVDYNYIQVPVGARHYFFLNDKASIFVNAAYVLDFALSGAQVQRNAQEPLTIERTTNFAVGAGFGYDRLSAEVRMDFSHGLLNNYQYWAADYSTIGVIVGYRFL